MRSSGYQPEFSEMFRKLCDTEKAKGCASCPLHNLGGVAGCLARQVSLLNIDAIMRLVEEWYDRNCPGERQKTRLHSMFAELRRLKQKELPERKDNPIDQARHDVEVEAEIRRVERMIEEEMEHDQS